MIKIAPESITHEDVEALREWLKDYPRLTQGDMVKKFEFTFGGMMGKFATMVNSGSSALLLALSLFKELKAKEKLKVVVPAVAWATDLAPVMQLGMEPILCDCNMSDLSVDIEMLQGLFEKERPDCLIFVSIVGLIPNMERIVELCDFYDVFMIEDACESFGSTNGGKMLGTFGDVGVYSMYFSHQVSTIEGGVIVTNKLSYSDKLKSMREFGWNRNCSPDFKNIMDKRNNVSEWESLFTFYYPGYNLRSNEISAFIGLRQLANFGKYLNIRNQLFWHYHNRLDEKCFWKPNPFGIDRYNDKSVDQLAGMAVKTDNVSCMAFPMIDRQRDVIIDRLKENGVESRPLVAGSLGRQPFYVNKYGAKRFDNADTVHEQGFYLPLHQDMSHEDVDKICAIVNKEGIPWEDQKSVLS